MVQPDIGSAHAVVHYGISVPRKETCNDRNVAGVDNDLCLLVIYLHLPNDVRNGEPHTGLYPWRCADARHCSGRAFQGEEQRVKMKDER